ncbi:pyridoxal-phosphate-dependent aminotransferase family protein [Salirhabdus salicampi]|uniref:pyridoxal-phosphate-dependent aminotransferase family protein n=1 Tax=Salirhabdus salicampi TaxID=476102 RepID=UPI0020C45189|nr:alanine--glyoxylate aminotransferase family protein [Salirhabdus salicampi]MCP8615289.1 alanine--glyoxylate aminotransferase family protein [Salirhabdus salicampi]
MLRDQHILRIPGPTPIPPSVQRAMNQPMIGHRGNESKQLIERIKPKLKPIFGTNQDVLLISGSGTAGLETAVVNTVSTNDEVLVIVTGAFGDRFVKICNTYGLQTHVLEVPWGEAVKPEQVEQFLRSHPNLKGVFATFCETSTGVLNPIEQIGKIVREQSNALFIVDGVSAVGGAKVEMDNWSIDVLVTGSQKAFMLPAGLTMVSVSERGWDVIHQNKQPRFYFDLTSYQKKLEDDSTPFTPALSLLFGLEQVLTLMEEEGVENVFKRHQMMKDMTRSAVHALGIPLLTSDEDASPTVTSIKPDDFSAEDLRKAVKEDFNLTLAGGQQHLKGKIFRVGHMGYCSPADVLQYIGLLEIGLTKIGKEVPLGAGVAAAQNVYVNREGKHVL